MSDTPYLNLGIVSAYADAKRGGYTGTYDEFCALLAGIAHLDDRYYTEDEVDTLLAGKAAAVHDHNDLYYTEAEVNSLLAGKANSGHTHDDRYYTEGEVNSLLANMVKKVSWDGTNLYLQG